MGGEERNMIGDLAEVLGVYTQAQEDLLQCVRRVRAQLRTEPSISSIAHSSHAAVVTQPDVARGSRIGAVCEGTLPKEAAPGAHPSETVPAPANAALIEAITAPAAHSVVHTHHDYDYFSELDRKLAELETKLEEGLKDGQTA